MQYKKYSKAPDGPRFSEYFKNGKTTKAFRSRQTAYRNQIKEKPHEDSKPTSKVFGFTGQCRQARLSVFCVIPVCLVVFHAKASAYKKEQKE